MKICGIQKTTLLDYPGHMAATIFLEGCNFRCPFCQNGDLVDRVSRDTIPEEELLSFLKKRASVLEGVCITGGEPTLQPRLEEFIVSIRRLGYKIKLDTNGYRPHVLKELCGQGLIDYVAMDIKTSRERYPVVSGNPSLEIDKIEESASFLMGGAIPYEFRTTVVKELHTVDDFDKIGRWLQGCSRYFLQNFVDSDRVLVPGFTSCSPEELLSFSETLKAYMNDVAVRGIDL